MIIDHKNINIIYIMLQKVLIIFILFILICSTVCLVLIDQKKHNVIKTKRLISKYIIKNNQIDQIATGDLLFFVSKDCDVVWLPYYLSHVAIIVRDGTETYVLDADPTLEGLYLVRLDEYISKYCGHIYYVKIKWSDEELTRISNNISNAITQSYINSIEESPLKGIANFIFNYKYSCIGLVTDIINNKKDNTKRPDDLLLELSNKIDYIIQIKEQSVNDHCYYSSGIWNPFIAKHVIQK